MEDSKGKWWDPVKERNQVKGAEEAQVIEAKYDRLNHPFFRVFRQIHLRR